MTQRGIDSTNNVDDTPHPGSVDLSIIIVSWNVWSLLDASLGAIQSSSDSDTDDPSSSVRIFGPPDAGLGALSPTLEVIVVDNDSSDASPEMVPARYPWVRYIQSLSLIHI